jgi:heat-inducible transcriptional repressor
VDELISPSQALILQIEHLLSERLQPHHTSIETLLRDAAQILATLSGCVALITRPQSSTTTIRHLHLLQVEPQRVMLILVTDTYETRSVLMELPGQPDGDVDSEHLDRELQILSNFLNHQLQGRSLNDLATLDWQELDREFQRYADVLKALLSELKQHRSSVNPTPILVGGLAEVLGQPEFSELEQAQALIHFLEDEQD